MFRVDRCLSGVRWCQSKCGVDVSGRKQSYTQAAGARQRKLTVRRSSRAAMATASLETAT